MNTVKTLLQKIVKKQNFNRPDCLIRIIRIATLNQKRSTQWIEINPVNSKITEEGNSGDPNFKIHSTEYYEIFWLKKPGLIPQNKCPAIDNKSNPKLFQYLENCFLKNYKFNLEDRIS